MTPLPVALLIVALATHAELLTRLRQVEERARPWWFGYARDGSNLSSTLMLWGTYSLAGLPSPEALLGAALTTLATYLVDWLFARALELRRSRWAVGLVLGSWVLLFAYRSGAIGAQLGHLIAATQPRR